MALLDGRGYAVHGAGLWPTFCRTEARRIAAGFQSERTYVFVAAAARSLATSSYES
jgi:hypothetical protein